MGQSSYSRIEQVKFVEDSLKKNLKGSGTWSILEYFIPDVLKMPSSGHTSFSLIDCEMKLIYFIY